MASLNGEWLLVFGEEEIGRLLIDGVTVLVLSDGAVTASMRFHPTGTTITLVGGSLTSEIAVDAGALARGSDVVHATCRSAAMPIAQPIDLVRLSADLEQAAPDSSPRSA